MCALHLYFKYPCRTSAACSSRQRMTGSFGSSLFDLFADFLQYGLVALALNPLPQRCQALVRSSGRPTYECQSYARVANLCAILRICMALLPNTELHPRFLSAALAAMPIAALLYSAVATTAPLSMPGLPCRCSKVGFRLGHTTFETRFLHLTCQTYTEKTALALPVLCRKIFFDMPKFAHVTLPWRPRICVMLGALATNAIFVVALPLASCKSCRWLALCAA